MSTSTTMAWRVVAFLLLWALAYWTMPWIGSPTGGFFEDDSWFYCQIAHSWATLGHPTFDTIHDTSGFHLTWGLLLSVASSLLALVTKSKLAHASLHAAIYLALLTETARSIAARARRPALTYLVVLSVFMLSAFAMETALLSLALLFLADRILLVPRNAHDHRTHHLLVSGLSALCVLARIDALLTLALWTPVAFRTRCWQSLLGGALLGLLLHFSAMHVVFGEFFSVSSLLKATSAKAGAFATVPKVGIVVRIAVLWIVLALALARIGSDERRFDRLLLLLGGCAFTFAHLVSHQARSWYFLPAWTICLWLGLATKGSHDVEASRTRAMALGWTRWLERTLIAMALGLVVYKVGRFVMLRAETKASWQFVEDIPHVVPEDGRIFEVDASGFPGFWGQRPLINGDGLVNTHAFARRLRSRLLAGYLEEENICYVITTARVRPRDKRLLLKHRGLVIRRDHAELLLSQTPEETQLWRLKRPHCLARE